MVNNIPFTANNDKDINKGKGEKQETKKQLKVHDEQL